MAKPKKQKNNMYQYRIRIKHPLSGKWIERSTTQRTIKLCYEWETKVRADLLAGANPDKVLIKDFFDLWFDTYKKEKVGPDHAAKIRITKKYVVKFFGKKATFKDLNRIKYQQWINFLAKDHAKATVSDYHKIFKAVIIEAQENGLLLTSPFRNASIIGKKPLKPKKKSLTYDEWKKLLKVVLESKETTSKYIVLTMMFVGARFQEVDGLLVSDVNLKEKKLSITKAFDYKRTKKATETKTLKAVREVDIPDVYIPILTSYIKRIRKTSNVVSIGPMYLFPGEDGIPITNAAVNKYLTKKCALAKIERITSHAFRHAKTDLFILAGADMIYTQNQLGHADISTTLKYYSTLNQDIKNKNLQIQNNFLNVEILQENN